MSTLPFAVYGTLRPGGRYQDRWSAGLGQHVASGHVTGWRLTHNGAYPYAIPTEPRQRIVVDVIAHMPGRYDALTASLDALEGYPDHYDRVQVQVETEYGDVAAWLYTPVSHHFDHFESVPGNDWIAFAATLADEDDEDGEHEAEFVGDDDYEPSVCPQCGKDEHTPDGLATCLRALTHDPWPPGVYGEDGGDDEPPACQCEDTPKIVDVCTVCGLQ